MTAGELGDWGQRIETLLKLAEAARQRQETRRSYEWKVNLALWSGLGLIAGFQFQPGEKAELGWWNSLFAALLLLMGYVYHNWWSYYIYNKNDEDRAAEENYLRLADHQLNMPESYRSTQAEEKKAEQQGSRHEKRGWKSPLENLSHRSQIAVTWLLIFFLIGALVIVRRPSIGKLSDSSKVNQFGQVVVNCSDVTGSAHGVGTDEAPTAPKATKKK